MRLKLIPPMMFAIGASGCSGWQSALDPRSPQADHLADLIWGFTIVCAVVWLIVMIVLAVALARRRGERIDPLVTDAARERRAFQIVGGAVLATTIVVLTLTAVSYSSQRKLFAKGAPAVTIKVTGHQWWWEVRYEDERPDRTFTTANEIHVPVGERIKLKLSSTDVIHSFWVPSLAGKQDLITGHENDLEFVAERAGVYRGQCAEFCGWQHSRMGVLVVATPRAEFDAWRDKQIAPAVPPDDPESQRGQQVFLSKPCMMCHSIRGTPAGGKVAPDLTHFGSRRYVAAGTLPMSRGSIGAWIVDPQGIKPGAHMPLVRLQADEIDPLVSYLAGLQ